MRWVQQHVGRKTAFISILLICCIFLADFVLPPPLHHAEDLSPVALDYEGHWLHAYTTDAGRWRFATDLNRVDPEFVARLVAIEDKRFYQHSGVDFLALLRASSDALRKGQINSGASTITMQTARLLEPRQRTILSKIVEIVRAFQIERRLSKQEILELYLTLTPYGGNLEGIRAASLSYFGKEPLRLTNAEQALLIALPQAPEARRPDRRAKAATMARNEILKKLEHVGQLTPTLVEEARVDIVPRERQSFPRTGYHTTKRLVESHGLDKGVLYTSLDIHLQQEAERLVRMHADQTRDGATASILVIDNATMAVRASVGSSGVNAPGGWIDLTRAVRSPGSTLKPLIYAIAFEDGLIGPNMVIEDMPRAFGDYTPENFDRTFRGQVRIKDALQHSLNLPAVSILDRLGAPRFAAIVNAAGAPLHGARRADKKEGLALALGGVGLTAQDLGLLYSAMANGGQAKSLIWTKSHSANTEKSFRLFSKQNALRVAHILREAPALAGRAPSVLSVTAPRISFKTGTSYGYRDAWAAGFDQRYTVIAWVGRADGASRPGVTGRVASAPLLFDMFDVLSENDDSRGFELNESDGSQLIAKPWSGTPKPAPEIIFPRTGVELFTSGVSNKGFSLAARGGAHGYKWYISGAPVPVESTSGRPIWRPTRSGFYDVVVIDREGRQAQSKVRVTLSG